MRVLLALTLLGVAASKEEACPIIKWLEEHGKDAFETVMACKDVPATLKKAYQSDCRTKPSPRDMVAMTLWYGITMMQHLNGTFPDFVKHSRVAEKIQDLATTQLIASTHRKLEQYCDRPECTDLSKTLSGVIPPCYASLVCNGMTKFVPFANCKDALETYMGTVMNFQLDSMCDHEEVVGLKGGHRYYYTEMTTDLMFKDMDCFIEYNLGGAKCTPKCLSQWQGMAVKFPKSTKAFGGRTQHLYEAVVQMMQNLAKFATDPNFKKGLVNMPKSIPTYDDTCNKNATVTDIIV